MDLSLHPVLVHFPIALIIFAFIFQILHLWKVELIFRTTSMWLLGFAVLTCFFATITGQKEAILAGKAGYETTILKTIQLHEIMANLTTWGSLMILLIWIYFFLSNKDDKRIDWIALAFLGLLSGIVIFTGFLGGLLAHGYGVGILSL